MHHMQLISDSLIGRYFCSGAAVVLLKNHPRIIKNDAKLSDAVGEVNAQSLLVSA